MPYIVWFIEGIKQNREWHKKPSDITFILNEIHVIAYQIYHTSIPEAGQFCEKGAIYSIHNLQRQAEMTKVHTSFTQVEV